MLEKFVEEAKSLRKVMLRALAFCVGTGILVSSYSPAVDNSHLDSALSPPYTFFLLNGDMELHRNR